MRYKCKLVVKNHLNDYGDDIFNSKFEMFLKYKKERDLFYKRIDIIRHKYYSLSSTKNSYDFNSKLNEFLNMGDEEFMEYLKRLLIQEINKNSKADKLDNDFTNKINILKKRSGKFFIDL